MGEAAAAAPAKADKKQAKAEAKLGMTKSEAKALAIVAEKRSQYWRDKAAAEAAVMAEVRARMRPIAFAEERHLDSKEQDKAVAAYCVGESAALRVFGLGQRLNGGRFGTGYVGALASAYVRLREAEANGACVNADGEFRSEEAQSTARDTAQKEAEQMIYMQEKIRYLMQTHSEVAWRLSQEMARIRNDHLAAAAEDDLMSCAAYDYLLTFLSGLWKDIKAMAASKVEQRGNEDDGDGGEYELFYESDDDADDGPYRF
jgi:hypothetical protein